MTNESGENLDDWIRQLHLEIANGIVDLGVARNFYLTLPQEDDWSFVVKLHALLEGVVNSYLADSIANPGMSAILERLPFGRRLELVGAASCLRQDEVQVISSVAALRHQLTHRAANTSFSFATADGQVQGKVAACVSAVINRLSFARKDADRSRTSSMEHAKRDPKGAIWVVLALTIRDWVAARICVDPTWQALAEVVIAHVERQLKEDATISREERQQLFLAVARLERHLSDIGGDESHHSRNRLNQLRETLCARVP